MEHVRKKMNPTVQEKSTSLLLVKKIAKKYQLRNIVSREFFSGSYRLWEGSQRLNASSFRRIGQYIRKI